MIGINNDNDKGTIMKKLMMLVLGLVVFGAVRAKDDARESLNALMAAHDKQVASAKEHIKSEEGKIYPRLSEEARTLDEIQSKLDFVKNLEDASQADDLELRNYEVNQFDRGEHRYILGFRRHNIFEAKFHQLCAEEAKLQREELQKMIAAYKQKYGK